MKVNEVSPSATNPYTQAIQARNAALKQDQAPDVKRPEKRGHHLHGVPKETDGTQQNEVLTGAEKQFFAQLFPNAESEIRSYRVYTNDGKPAATASGTLIDRKG